MAAFSKSFFSLPPNDPDEPGFQQDSNRSLKESHSTGKEITEFLSNYDNETITSLDGTKYNVLAQREGSDETVETWWTPTPAIKDGKIAIAKGSVTAPWDDRGNTTLDAATSPGGDSADGVSQKINYKHFQPLTPEPLELIKNSNNYYFIKATFTMRYFQFITIGHGAPHFSSFSYNTANADDGDGDHNHAVGYPTYQVTNYSLKSVADLEVVRGEGEDAFNESDTISSGVNAYVHQYLGHYNLDYDGKIIDKAWRTGHTIDFRMPTITMQLSQYPTSPNN